MNKFRSYKEVWKPAYGLETVIEVSDLGNVRYVDGKKKRLNQIFCPRSGYYRVSICKVSQNVIAKSMYVHRLVAEAFFGAIGRDKTVVFIDGDKTNVVLSNLKVITKKEEASNPERLAKIKQTLNIPERKAKQRLSCSKASSRQLDFMEVNYPHRELTFSNSYLASSFFGYTNPRSLSTNLGRIRVRGENIVTIGGVDYYFYHNTSSK